MGSRPNRNCRLADVSRSEGSVCVLDEATWKRTVGASIVTPVLIKIIYRVGIDAV